MKGKCSPYQFIKNQLPTVKHIPHQTSQIMCAISSVFQRFLIYCWFLTIKEKRFCLILRHLQISETESVFPIVIAFLNKSRLIQIWINLELRKSRFAIFGHYAFRHLFILPFDLNCHKITCPLLSFHGSIIMVKNIKYVR